MELTDSERELVLNALRMAQTASEGNAEEWLKESVWLRYCQLDGDADRAGEAHATAEETAGMYEALRVKLAQPHPDPRRCANPWHGSAPARMVQSCPECPRG